MTEPKPPDAPQPPAATTPDAEPEAAPRGERLGTVLMAVAITAVAVLVIDVAMKGRLLAPLFALLPAPKTAAEEPPDAAPRAAGD